MEKVLNQMEQYDFSTPINVTMIFEDSDDESSYTNILKEQHQNNNNKHKVTSINIQEKTVQNNKDYVVINETNSTKEVLSKENIIDTQRIIEIRSHTSPNAIENKLTESSYSMPDITNASKSFETVNQQTYLTTNNCLVTKNTNSNISDAPSDTQANERGELNGDVYKLLDVVSEHLILIMIQYYHLYSQTRNGNAAKAAELSNKLNKLKAHFFDLSYSTVVSIILPQEKNEWFTDRFFNKTIAEANKILQWKCNRKHLEPIYLEMITWVKHKRNHIKALKGISDKKNNNNRNINDNRLLKERLNDPPRALYVTHTTNDPKELGVRVYNPTGADLPSAQDQNLNTDNNMCIFSSGTPGNNISISINPDILVQQSRQHYEAIPQSSPNITQISTNSNLYTTNSPVAPNQAHYDQRFNVLEQNGYPQRHTIHHKPVTSRPPPYYAAHKLSATPTTYKNLHQKKSAPNVQNYQTQQNMNPSSVSIGTYPNLGHMYYSQVKDHLTTTTPVITQVTSLNQNHSPNLVSFPVNGRCCICGKNTSLRCSRCENFSYCSYLCQELDAAHKTRCRH